jgi:Calcineurin-like phosphoesterase
MSTIVVGDVHGCLDELRDLLAACRYGAGDELVLVGDLVAKGPDSRGVLALVRELGARSVLGNHDAHVLHARNVLLRGAAPVRSIRPATAQLARQLDDRDWQVLDALPLWLALPEYGALVVHAGIEPGKALAAQDPELLMNMRTIRPDGRGSRRREDGVLWGSLWPGPELVLFGHHATAGLQRHPFALGLDTGCVYGKQLSACLLPERRIVSVPARRAYQPIEEEA